MDHMNGLVLGHHPRMDAFLDIGCGSGLFTTVAANAGFKKVVGFDYDPNCVEVSRRVAHRLASDPGKIQLMQGDVLDGRFMGTLGRFSVVYAWGSLHHTNSMWEAINNGAQAVEEDGLLVLAIYNKSWSSPFWKWVKRAYHYAPDWVRFLMIRAVCVVAAIAKAVYTGSNPFAQDRGMSFYYNIVDWVGGYPYEYASVSDMMAWIKDSEFELLETRRGKTPIACNEFVLRKKPGQAARNH